MKKNKLQNGFENWKICGGVWKDKLFLLCYSPNPMPNSRKVYQGIVKKLKNYFI